ncbi:hypothetical protein BKA67DRAFT_655253 [Truncatella angustata]|uniref:Uncharacterized protein n=1 Tax=Truncatella angustata TaxID=152316 RepID=A0A9P8UR61_9PEZI|nr:uncharacterized protein BKA67DRAFT_655253 [Truncatella angustata]KAH6656952.1 hypothetical protein BKA67DRAFT_655253 [Truncatella angustata]KAH8195879.1 hypothetical protein TruAng_009955 [Truncatella angustata]
MASTAGFPLYLHQDETSILMLSDSEDEDGPPTPRDPHHPRGPSRAESRTDSIEQDEDEDADEDEGEAMRKRTKDAAANVPLHPIPALQSAFAESLVEATADPIVAKPKLRFGDAKERRARLIDSEKDAKLYNDFWRYRPGQIHHELSKLMAQISFGVYLLLNGIANSNVQVVNILQGHIDEVDEFLEVTMEDVKLATDDIQERIDFLKLPMQNISTFEKMLEDRAFRLQIVTGNEKIEHIVSRTSAALEGSLDDVEEGLKATKEFAVYLGDQQNQPWKTARPDVVDIFDAMKGNAEGWYKAFVDLQENASMLDNQLIKLGQMVADMDRRAGEVSRRTTVSPMSGAYSLSLRASALMPLQFSVTPFSGPAAGASRTSVISPQASRKSSQRSTSSRAHSTSVSSRTESMLAETRSPSQKSPPSSPNVRDTLPDFQFKPLHLQSSLPKESLILEIDTASEPDEETIEPSRPSPIAEEETLFVLQPRTYTPQPPTPLPSPMVHSQPATEPVFLDSRTYTPPAEDQPAHNSPANDLAPLTSLTYTPPAAEPAPLKALVYTPPVDHQPIRNPPTPESPKEAPAQVEEVSKRTSLRQRLSLRGNAPPDSIRIPPRSMNRPKYQSPQVQHAQEIQVPDESPRVQYAQHIQIPDQSPRIQYAHQTQRHDSCTSDMSRPPLYPPAESLHDFPSPPVFHHTIPSPLSDQQYFRPVQASPHSPLQRPWTSTSGHPPFQRPHTSATQYQQAKHQRNAPSAMGMSMLSNVTTMNTEGKTLKKKRSAFGWLKKAFSLDEEERAAFEARKQQPAPNLYYEGRSPKYLDGRKRDEYRGY